MVRRKKSRWSKKAKIVTTIGIIIAICAGVFATIYITNPSMLSMPQGYFGLFGAGDYNTGLSLNTETQYFKDTGVEGYGGLLSPVYYRLITGGYGPIVKITAQGGMTVEQNRPPEQFWIDPYMIDKIDGYWYEVYWKNSTTDWTKIIDKTNTRSWWAVHYEEAIGTGFQTGWTMPLGASHRFECNPITFWVRCSDKGCGVKVELHAKISWTVGGMSQRTEGKDDVLLASDEAYGTQQPPQQAQPTAPKLTITTTPGASVQVSGQEIKTADELGVAIWENLPTDVYQIVVSKVGYLTQYVQINYPGTSEIIIRLQSIGAESNALIVGPDQGDCIIVVKNKNGIDMEQYFTTKYGDYRWEKLPKGKYVITVSKEGYETQSMSVTMPGAGTVYFYMKKQTTPGQQPPVQPPPTAPKYNQRPQIRTIEGSHSGDTGIAYEFTVTAVDPDGDALLYRFYWGDGTSTGWLSEGRASHSYTSSNTFTISVQAFDGISYSNSIPFTFSTGGAVAGGNELTVPLITLNNFQKGAQTFAIIQVQTPADAGDFEIKAYVKDPSGAYIVREQTISKTKDGDMYTARISFTCNVNGIVAVGAKAVAIDKQYSDSVVSERLAYCVSGAVPTGLPPQPSETGAPETPSVKIPGFDAVLFLVALGVTALIFINRRKKL